MSFYKTDFRLGIEDMEFDQNGLKNFYWPIDGNKIAKFREDFLNEMIPELRFHEKNCFNKKKVNVKETLNILFKWFALSNLNLYQSKLIVDTFEKNKIKLNIPSRFTILKSLDENQPIETDFEKWWNGPENNTSLPVFIKSLLLTFHLNKFSTLLKLRHSNKTIAINRNNLLKIYAKKNKNLVMYKYPSDFFGPISTQIPNYLTNQISKEKTLEISKILEKISTIFKNNGVLINSNMKEYLFNWIIQSHVFLQFYLDSLYEKNIDINKLLVVCSGSQVWSQILTFYVNSTGGKVINFDHGNGGVYYAHHHYYTDYQYVNKFITYKQAYVECLKRNLNKKFLLNNSVPNFEKINTDKNIFNFTQYQYKKKEIKKLKIMYVSTIYTGYSSRLRTVFADPVFFDFKVRLMGHLSKWGHKIFYKPHPGGRSQDPKKLAEKFGHKTLYENFENTKEKNDTDIYIIDYLPSTTSAPIICSGKPVIFINLDTPLIFENELKILKNSIYLLPGTVSSNNRIEINFDDLKSIINKIQTGDFENKNTIFQKTFFNEK